MAGRRENAFDKWSEKGRETTQEKKITSNHQFLEASQARKQGVSIPSLDKDMRMGGVRLQRQLCASGQTELNLGECKQGRELSNPRTHKSPNQHGGGRKKKDTKRYAATPKEKSQ